jgi:hypothetical protein
VAAEAILELETLEMLVALEVVDLKVLGPQV